MASVNKPPSGILLILHKIGDFFIFLKLDRLIRNSPWDSVLKMVHDPS